MAGTSLQIDDEYCENMKNIILIKARNLRDIYQNILQYWKISVRQV